MKRKRLRTACIPFFSQRLWATFCLGVSMLLPLASCSNPNAYLTFEVPDLSGSSADSQTANSTQRLEMNLSSVSVPADGVNSIQVTMIVQDLQGKPLSGRSMKLASSRGSTAEQITAVNSTTDSTGKAVFTIKSTFAGSSTFTAQNVTDQVTLYPASPSVIFQPGPATQFALSGIPNPALAGVNLNLNITALDAFGNRATGYVGTLVLNSNDPGANLPVRATFTPLDQGSKTFTFRFRTVTSSRTISVGDLNYPTIIGSQTGILILPAPATSFVVTGFAPIQTAGISGNVTFTALDTFGNTINGYQGKVHFSSSDTRATLPEDYTFQLTDSGTKSLPFTLITAGPGFSIQVAEVSNPLISGMQQGITIVPSIANRLALTGLPSSQTAGVPNTLNVRVQDAYSNTVSGYTGTISFVANDTQATLPGSYTFQISDQGSRNFSQAVTLRTAGNRSITSSDSAAGIQGVFSPMVILPAAPTLANSSLQAAPTDLLFANGTSAATLTVTLRDVYQNAVSGMTPSASLSGSANTLSAFTPTDSSGISTARVRTTLPETKIATLTFPAGFSSLTSQITYYAPTLAITSPLNGSYINVDNNSATFTVSGTCTLNTRVVNLMVDGSNAPDISGGVCDGTSFLATFNTLTLTQATHDLVAVLSDATGNSLTSSVVSLIKDTAVPIVNMATPTQLSVVNRSNVAAFPVNGTCSHKGVTVNVIVTSGVTTLTQTSVCGTLNDWSTTFDLTSLVEGTVNFRAYQTNISGATGSSPLVSINKDTVAPTLDILVPTQNTIVSNGNNSSTFTVSGTCDEASAAITIRVDGSAAPGSTNPACASDLTFSGSIDTTQIPEGTHTLTATFSDLAQNIGTSSALALHKRINATSFLVSDFPSPQTAGVTGKIVVTAQDIAGFTSPHYQGTITFQSSDTHSSSFLPATYTFTAGDQGTHTFTSGVRLTKSGIHSITVQEVSNASLTGSQSGIIILPSLPVTSRSSINATPSSKIFANGISSSTVTVTLKDTYGNNVTGFSPTLVVSFPSGDQNRVMPATNSSGTSLISLTSLEPGGIFLEFSDPSDLENQATIEFGDASIPQGLSIIYPQDEAYITNDQNVTNYAISGNCSITSGVPNIWIYVDGILSTGEGGDPGATCVNNLFFTSIDVTGLSETDHTLTAVMTDVNFNYITSLGISVTKRISAANLFLTALPATVTAGIPQNVTVTVKDFNGNTATGFVGMIEFDSDDTLVDFPNPTYTFTPSDQGTHNFTGGVIFKSAGSRFVEVWSEELFTSARQSTVVLPAAASPTTSTLIANPATNLFADGQSRSTLTVELKDAYGNAISSIIPQISISSPTGTSTRTLSATNNSGIATGTLRSTVGETKTLTIISPTGLTQTTATVTYFIPVLNISSPSSNAFINISSNSTSYTVSGTCSMDSVPISVAVNSITAPGLNAGNCSGGVFSSTINTTSLTEGTHTFTASMTDAFSSRFTSSGIVITKDTVPPSVGLTVPAPLSSIDPSSVSTFTIGGTCSEPTRPMSISFTDGTQTASGSTSCGATGLWSTTLDASTLNSGTITFTAGTTDIAGNTSSTMPIGEIDPSWTPGFANLVGYWQFNDGISDVSNAFQMRALLGPNGSATNPLGNGLIFLAGILNQALSFDGLGTAYVKTSSFTSMPTGNSSRTVTAWIYDEGSDNSNGAILTMGQGGCPAQQFGFGKFSGAFNIWGGCNDFQTTLMIPASQWTFIAATYNGSQITAYLNGGSQSQDVGSLSTQLSSLFIGAETDDNGTTIARTWKGMVDEVAVWNTALTSSQISEIYNRQKTQYRGPASAVYIK